MGRDHPLDRCGSKGSAMSPAEFLKREIKPQKILWEQHYVLENSGQLTVALGMDGDLYRMILVTDIVGPLLMHWGAAKHSRGEWSLPPAGVQPAGTVIYDDHTVQTPFKPLTNGLSGLTLEINSEEKLLGITFVLFKKDEGHWLKENGRDFYLPVHDFLDLQAGLDGNGLSLLAEEIIAAEMGSHSWTLMHRFNLCYDLSDRVGGDLQGLALLFVWLRFSALRQLDWQRNYNTQPRDLSHALDRLTCRLADIFPSAAAGQEILRLIFTTLGRGAEGQKVRDGILEIMHRHHIKEVTGHFFEEWHQKLHNNTTPDDVVICEAYLGFLRSDGDLGFFYNHLKANGVTKERLEHYERPIRSDPDFIHHLKDGLIHDFEYFLKTLKALHTGLDLELAINSVRGRANESLQATLDFIGMYQGDSHMSVVELVGRFTEARTQLNSEMKHSHGNWRDWLFLDLALEASLRRVVERNLQPDIDKELSAKLIGAVLENLCLSGGNDEIAVCFRQWQYLQDRQPFSQQGVLHAAAVMDRLDRALGDYTTGLYKLLQPKAETLGKAFHAEGWTIDLFSEEIIRGTLVSILSLLVASLQPVLRKIADLGDWQIISHGQGTGRLEAVEQLSSIQGQQFEHPTVILADKVSGYEEIPKGIRAIITPDRIDLLSHLAIRVRNVGLLFAVCYNPETIRTVRSFQGQNICLTIAPSGELTIEKGQGATFVDQGREAITPRKIVKPPAPSSFAISMNDFKKDIVGEKALNQKKLVQGLPEWIHSPVSVSIPFGVFEAVRKEPCNKKIEKRYRDLFKQIDDKDSDKYDDLPAKLYEAVLEFEAPGGLLSALYKVLEASGLVLPEKGEDVWSCIKQVWASIWNERAYLSRKVSRISHEDIFMAVLVQQVIEAEYAFVIHTVDPLSKSAEILYGEIVMGLGETLVSNYPGQALGFAYNKADKKTTILSYPSKSEALYGQGLIFRSDSSGEDLAGYAGAGLYDSIMLEPPQKVRLEYINDPLVWDHDIQNEMLSKVADIGIIVEKMLGSPQDIEGVVSKGRYYVVQTRPQV